MNIKKINQIHRFLKNNYVFGIIVPLLKWIFWILVFHFFVFA